MTSLAFGSLRASASPWRVGLLTVALASGCYSEGLNVQDISGTILLPKEAVTRTFERPQVDENGDAVLDDQGEPIVDTEVVEDPRLIGPVYVGLYASVRSDLEAYPHPERGPNFQGGAGFEGDTYPYGGSTVGNFRFGCLEFLKCKMVSGRYTDFDAIVDWFSDVLQTPIKDAAGNDVTNGDYIRQACYELLAVTSDLELGVTATEDRNEDGKIDAGDLDFVKNANGDYEAPFLVRQQDIYPGMSAWAFMDTPSDAPGTYDFTTCNPELGYSVSEYNQDFEAGTQRVDVLNRPSEYLTDGDWVATGGYIWEDPETPAEIVIDFQIGADTVAADDGGGQ